MRQYIQNDDNAAIVYRTFHHLKKLARPQGYFKERDYEAEEIGGLGECVPRPTSAQGKSKEKEERSPSQNRVIDVYHPNNWRRFVTAKGQSAGEEGEGTPGEGQDAGEDTKALKRVKAELEKENGVKGFTPVPTALKLGEQDTSCSVCLKKRSACQAAAALI